MEVPDVLKRFPEHWTAICRLLDASEAFRETCRDYEQALLAAPPSADAEGAEAYATLLAELESEILHFIEEEECSPDWLSPPIEGQAPATVSRSRPRTPTAG